MNTSQYRDPKWLELRGKILQRDNGQCQRCGKSHGTMQVHHLWYDKNRDIWEYKDYNFVTLCYACHEAIHHSKDILNTTMIKFMRASCYSLDEDNIIGLELAITALETVSRSNCSDKYTAKSFKSILEVISSLASENYQAGQNNVYEEYEEAE